MSGIYGIISTYTPTLLSHQTGLSVTVSTANTFYAIGSAISVPRNGIGVISLYGHVSANNGYIKIELTRGSNSYYLNSPMNTLFSDSGYQYFSDTTPTLLFANGGSGSYGLIPFLITTLYSGDSLQFYATNNTANDITYIDDLLVMLI